MAKNIKNTTIFALGIADSKKFGEPGFCRFTRGLDFRSDPAQMTVLPRASLISGTVIKGLPMWHDRVLNKEYFYDDTGRIYSVDSDNLVTQEHFASNSKGNGLRYFGEDKSLYYAQNTTFGRYGRVDQNPSYSDDVLGSIGGDPTNTHSLNLVAASNQYASVADHADFDITGNLSLEAFIKPASFPGELAEQVIVSKWDTNSDERSFKLSIASTAASFGSGTDGALTISTNTTEAPIDANFSASAGATSFTISNVTGSFAAGQRVLLHQTRGANVGKYEVREILSVVSTTVTLTETISNTYAHSATAGDANKAQIRVLPQYTNVTINSGVTYTAKAWDGLKGGIIGFFATGTVTVTGHITATGKGFRAAPQPQNVTGYQGEGSSGYYAISRSSNGNGGGGGSWINGFASAGGGGGGGHATAGDAGYNINGANTGGAGGTSSSDANLTTLTFGGAGGSGGRGYDNGDLFTNLGGDGGGIVYIISSAISVAGSITANGMPQEGGGNSNQDGNGGSGAGGAINIKALTAALGSGLVTATGAPMNTGTVGHGGAGSSGRIAVYYATSVTGTSNPTFTSNLDQTLAATSGYEARLSISSNGTNEERYFVDISNSISIDSWARLTVAWAASISTARFYINGNEIGTMTRSLTTINNSTAAFAIGADFNSTARNFFDGRIDDARIWNKTLTASEVSTRNLRVLTGNEAALVSYFPFDNNFEDKTANNHDLTGSGTPTFSSDVPFSGISSRIDEDQLNDTVGDIYNVPTSISESDTNRATFVPEKDPNKSVILNINTVGTGNWTVTIHDPQNNVVATKTVLNANVTTGFFEFIFDEVWRPIRGATYHFHVTSSIGDGKVVAQTTDDLETAYYSTHFQFLIDDKYHPIEHMLNFLVIGNERYVAKYEAGEIYDPHRIVLPSGHRVRCFAFWREFLVIGTWQGEKITDKDSGRLFLWDGISDEINYYIDVPEGGINAALGSRGDLFFIAGYSGDLMVYRGGDRAEKIKRIPKAQRQEFVEVFPGNMSMWRTILQIGVGSSDSTTLERGVYSWGSLNERLPEALNMEHPTSLGVQTTANTTIGVVAASGKKLYIGWQSGTTYGLDIVDSDGLPYSESATYETLIDDMGTQTRRELPQAIRADFEPLREGEEVTISYRRDRDNNWRQLAHTAEVGNRFVRSEINVDANELELKLDIKCTQTSPTITGFGLEFDDERSGISA